MNVLAIGSHPDDLEISCAGTLAKYVQCGHTVIMCHITHGDKGHMIIKPDELKGVRIQEAKNAGEIIGSKEVICLDIDDLEVNSENQVIVRKIIDVIRYAKPDLIITHNPDDYMKDHMEASRLVFNASFSSSVPHMFTQNPHYENVVPVFYMETLAGVNFLPEEYVDITQTMQTKLDAINCHQSQIKYMREHDNIDFIDFIRTINKFRGLQCSCEYAEGFRRCTSWPRMTAKRLLP